MEEKHPQIKENPEFLETEIEEEDFDTDFLDDWLTFLFLRKSCFLFFICPFIDNSMQPF